MLKSLTSHNTRSDFASGAPAVLDTTGTVRAARGFTSMRPLCYLYQQPGIHQTAYTKFESQFLYLFTSCPEFLGFSVYAGSGTC